MRWSAPCQCKVTLFTVARGGEPPHASAFPILPLKTDSLISIAIVNCLYTKVIIIPRRTLILVFWVANVMEEQRDTGGRGRSVASCLVTLTVVVASYFILFIPGSPSLRAERWRVRTGVGILIRLPTKIPNICVALIQRPHVCALTRVAPGHHPTKYSTPRTNVQFPLPHRNAYFIVALDRTIYITSGSLGR